MCRAPYQGMTRHRSLQCIGWESENGLETDDLSNHIQVRREGLRCPAKVDPKGRCSWRDEDFHIHAIGWGAHRDSLSFHHGGRAERNDRSERKYQLRQSEAKIGTNWPPPDFRLLDPS